MEAHHFPAFDTDSDKNSVGPRWKRYIDRLENFFVTLKLKDSEEDDAIKRAHLLHYAGESVYDIYMAKKGEGVQNYANTKKVLADYFQPQTNIQMEIFKFRNSKQQSGQTLDEWVTELRKLAKNCQFHDNDREILTQVIQCCSSHRLRRRALRDSKQTLKNLLELGRTLELADTQATAMENDETVNKVSTGARQKTFTPRNTDRQKKKDSNGKTQNRKYDKQKGTNKKQGGQINIDRSKCIYCGGDFPHKGVCPARGKTCHFCKTQNHFQKVCIKLQKKQSEVNAVQEKELINSNTDTSEDEYCYTIRGVNQVKKHSAMVDVLINQKKCEVMIDTGASENIIDETLFNQLGSPQLHRASKDLFAYGSSTPLTVLGQCRVKIRRVGGGTTAVRECTFRVAKGDHGSLLGNETAQALGLVKIINQIRTPVDKYPELFKGIGKLKGKQVKLHIDETVKPIAQNTRRTPFHLRDKVATEIAKLVDADIIEKVEGEATPWVSPIVTAAKKNNDEIRLCVDMRAANKAIERERHQSPTMDEITHDLNGATVFSKLDLRKGYHQLELHKDSRPITTFATHLGLYRYKRLSFGVCSAAEVFHETIRSEIRDIPNSKNSSDPILVAIYTIPTPVLTTKVGLHKQPSFIPSLHTRTV